MCRANGTPRRSRSDEAAGLCASNITPDELINFTPELHAKALELAEHYAMGPMFNPAVVSKVGGPIAEMGMSTAAAARIGQAVDTILKSISSSRRHRIRWVRWDWFSRQRGMGIFDISRGLAGFQSG